jgi:SpoVK/Ycf46/Vps4 family AAA+-type ATPase
LNKFILTLDELQQMKNEDILSRKIRNNTRRGKNKFKNIDYEVSNFFSLSPTFVYNNKPHDALLETIKRFIRESQHVKCETPKKIKERIKVDIQATVKNINDLILLIDSYKLEDHIDYNINMKSLHNMKDPLIQLNTMIGMNTLKENIVDQIIYFIQNLHVNSGGDYMHTIISGPPGTGKTEIAKIMGQLYSKMGVLSKGTFKKATRSDLIAGYLGQTAIKTTNVVNESLGGVLFIDEAYALGNSDKKDSFSKECIDTLCEAMSNHKENLMVIIAGYENELKESFFTMNQGLESRFTWRFKTDDYKAEELYKIFLKMVKQINWEIHTDSEKNINISWFEKKMEYFKYYGRDMEMLLSKIKISHGKRVFCKLESEKKKITFEDLEQGFEIYLQNDEIKNRKNESVRRQMLSTIYV